MHVLFLSLTRALEHVFCLGESRLSQVNNNLRPNVFLAGVANFVKAMYRSLERSTHGTSGMDFFIVQCPGLIFLAALWSGPAILGHFGLHPSSLSKSAGFVFLSGKASLVSMFAAMFIFCWSSNFVEKVLLIESMVAKIASRFSYLVYYNCI